MRDPLQDKLSQFIRPGNVVFGCLSELQLSNPLQPLGRGLLIFLLERGRYQGVGGILGAVLHVKSEAKFVVFHLLIPFLLTLVLDRQLTLRSYVLHVHVYFAKN